MEWLRDKKVSLHLFKIHYFRLTIVYTQGMDILYTFFEHSEPHAISF